MANNLFTLPRELRDYIYELALEPGEICLLSQQRSISCPTWSAVEVEFGEYNARAMIPPPLVAVCRQIRSEVLPLFYGLNTFTAYFPNIAPRMTKTYAKVRKLRKRLNFLDTTRAGMVKNLVIRVPLPEKECLVENHSVECGCKGWRPATSLDVARIFNFADKGIKDKAVRAEYGSTIKGVFWKDLENVAEELGELEWHALP